jgi:hypothetical protein
VYRRKIILSMALAFIIAVLFSLRGNEEAAAPDSTDAPVVPVGVEPATGAYRGVVSASWHEQPAAPEPQPEAADDLGATRDPVRKPPADPLAGMPEKVRERLAREYVGLDIAVARPAKERKGAAGK